MTPVPRPIRRSRGAPHQPLRAGIRRRTRKFVLASTLAVLAAIVAGALVLGSGLERFASSTADQRAQSAVDLLVTIGPRLPRLTPAGLDRGLSRQQGASLDKVVAEGQRTGGLSDLTIWNRHGVVLYSASSALEGTRPPLEPEVRAALAGHPLARRHPGEVDLTSGRRTGVLDSFDSLRDEQGHVFGAVEVSLPLKPIAAGASRVKWRLGLLLGGGALVLWLLAMPLVIRAARVAAVEWIPGRRRLLRAFDRALTQGRVEMVYQPQVNPVDGGVHAAEALVRWRRDGSLLAPDTFLPVIENSPLMGRLTDRVLALALAEAGRCDDEGHSLRMSINCSARDLNDPDLALRIEEALERAALTGDRLTLEVTETALADDPEGARLVLDAIAGLGVEIAIDDFGTGHASISRLRDLPVSEVKIDRSFMGSDDSSRAYVEAITSFGRALGMRVVGEGVEDQETMNLLALSGCDLAQGYFVSRPMSGAELRIWLAQRHASGGSSPPAEIPVVNV
ncbi:MAG: diguanylate cyclase protein [Solirubrobacteraceae bacterium]|nr:diguanylate cyclase protein [Solirubrobacteraceae bacterium]